MSGVGRSSHRGSCASRSPARQTRPVPSSRSSRCEKSVPRRLAHKCFGPSSLPVAIHPKSLQPAGERPASGMAVSVAVRPGWCYRWSVTRCRFLLGCSPVTVSSPTLEIHKSTSDTAKKLVGGAMIGFGRYAACCTESRVLRRNPKSSRVGTVCATSPRDKWTPAARARDPIRTGPSGRVLR